MRRAPAAEELGPDDRDEVDQAADRGQEDDDLDPGKDIAPPDRVHDADADQDEGGDPDGAFQIGERVQQRGWAPAGGVAYQMAHGAADLKPWRKTLTANGFCQQRATDVERGHDR
jgi:hypothetical protein